MLVLVVGCGGGGARREPAAGSATTPDPGSAAPAPAALSIPKTGAFTLPTEYTQCTADADCTFTALGCCDTTAVAKKRAAEVHAALEASGRQYCPVKTACGPGPHGTWEDTPGACVSGSCTKPSVTPGGVLAIPVAGPIVVPAKQA